MLWKFFLYMYSRCCKFIDAHMSNAGLKGSVWSIKSTVVFGKTVFSVYFSYIEIQRWGMYFDVKYYYPFIIISKLFVVLSTLRVLFIVKKMVNWLQSVDITHIFLLNYKYSLMFNCRKEFLLKNDKLSFLVSMLHFNFFFKFQDCWGNGES